MRQHQLRPRISRIDRRSISHRNTGSLSIRHLNRRNTGSLSIRHLNRRNTYSLSTRSIRSPSISKVMILMRRETEDISRSRC